ncbi:hypothetical protein G4B88_030148 [Cannabis sativa]|uniref:Uncharacterized protein n=1 Tax=Cannabis sativa TaxID=3483 RepID=A0A7J6E049_CANSA|nr:hypothetical protein G4B88_030148 [Cannabis sativa]
MIIDNPGWLSQLTSLKQLVLTNCQLLKVPDHISSSSLSHSNYSFTSLQEIEIVDGFIHPATINWLLNSSVKLNSLELSNNNLRGTLHDLLGNISSSTKNSLETLYLSFNQLGGLILDDFKNTFPSLTNLRLDNNQLEGHFPNCLKRFPNLKSLVISHNQFFGLLPDLSSMPNLESFEASNNKFSGVSSESIGKLDYLYLLIVSINSLTGYVSHVNLQCPSLKNLDFSFNSDMSLKFDSKYYIPSFQLETISLASCKLGTEFPNWLKTQTNLQKLDISNSGIYGPVPKWFTSITPNLNYLDMSHNLLNNTLSNFPLAYPNMFDDVIVDLSSNQFQGSVPPSLLVHATCLYLSNNKFNRFSSFLCEAKERVKSTQLLDLSNNNLFENIPHCWDNFSQLFVLNLGYNKLFGNIPNSINMKTLKTLQLRHNNFSGNFPSSLKDCTSLLALDLENNSLEGPIPSWIGEKLSNLVFLSLKSNKFDGIIPLSLCQLTQIQILDLSSNDLSRAIPSCIKNFTSMIRVNNSRKTILSDVRFSNGPIPDLSRCSHCSYSEYTFSYENYASIIWKGVQYEYGKILGLLRVIDLSCNKLNGEIPMEVTHLSLLDLSNNRLTGRIPTGPQLQLFNASTYSMNLGLCGNPLPSSCPGDDDNESSHVPASNLARDDDGDWLYVVIIIKWNFLRRKLIDPIVEIRIKKIYILWMKILFVMIINM